MPMSCSLKVQAESSCTERNPIGHRTQPDRTPNATRSDTERNPIGHRTQSDRTANAIGRSPLTFIYENGK